MQRLRVGAAPATCDVVLGDGCLAELGRLASEVFATGPCAVVTDRTLAASPHLAVAEGALRAAGFRPTTIVVPAGEAAKSLAEAERLWTALAAADLDRRRGIVALGGGAVGDVAGFCAATFLRGVPWIVVPTTLLAMADSSVGGKTAVNLPAGKNLVGAFHAPSLVVADPATLATLPARELRSGFAEIVKCGVLADRARLDALAAAAPLLLARDAALLTEAVAFAVRVKDEHVRGDATDVAGVRALLNLGHTTAHALEAAAGYGAMLHGEAVAVGLVVAARVGARLGHCDAELEASVTHALRAFGLPTAVPAEFDPEDLVARTRHDKKRSDGQRKMVVPRRSHGAALVTVDDATLLAALA